jgi:peptide/nickel transport system permease protein
MARGEVLKLKEMDYVALAKVAGASPFRIITRHIFPGMVNTVVILATLQIGTVIIAESSLSFLGVGVPPPTASWGVMIADGRNYLLDAWWAAVFPAVAILLTTLPMNFLGDWMRDHLDPRLRPL